MTPVLNEEKKCPITDIKAVIYEKILQWRKKIFKKEQRDEFIRMGIPIDDMDILKWIASQTQSEKVYWSDREGRGEFAGLGEADCWKIDSESDVQNSLTKIVHKLKFLHPDTRYYGGLCFDEGNGKPQWSSFSIGRFFLPRFEIQKENGSTFFVCNIFSSDLQQEPFEDMLALLEKINFSFNFTENLLPPLKSREDSLPKNQWELNVNRVLEDFDTNRGEKVVLANKACLSFEDDLDPFVLVQSLKGKTIHCFHFCFQFNSREAFLGASPERLYQRNKNDICTEALAGTRPRGANFQEDEDLKTELLNSKKDFREHQYVATAVEAGLKDLCLELRSDAEISLLKLNGGQHLISQFQGKLKPYISDVDILESLHPTPAVAGSPTGYALKKIRTIEPFRRGWYAGPVGYIGNHSSEFAVAIRSGLIRQNKLSVYAGAGIVKGSDPEQEWDEIQNKMNSFLKALPDEIRSISQY